MEDWWRLAVPASPPVISSTVLAALADDLNTPKAIAELHAIRNRISHPGVGPHAVELAQNLAFLGFDRASFLAWEAIKTAEALKTSSGLDEVAIEKLIDARNAARKTRNFKESDRIRDELAAMGVVLKDSKEGTTWEIAR